MESMKNLLSELSQLGHQGMSDSDVDTSRDGKVKSLNEKSLQESINLRQQGNILFKKKKHDETDHRRILYFYNKSIAYAPPNSEELALAYSNRAVLWLHLKKYEFSLMDISRADGITKSEELKKKLAARKLNSQNLNQSMRCKTGQKKVKLPAFAPSKMVPCAADSLTLKYDKKYGRHFIANRNIRPGEIVMIEETPYISVNANQVYLICSHCFAFAWAGIPCDSCVFTIYCNESCKEAAWNQYHDTMCSKLPSLQCWAYDQDMFSSQTMATRILDIFIKKEGLDSVMKDATDLDKNKVMNLETLLSNNKVDCKKFRSLYNLVNCKENGDAGPAIMKYIFAKVASISQFNSFTFRTSTACLPPAGSKICDCMTLESCMQNNCQKRGDILGVCSSLINHGCDPNVVRMFLPGPKMVLLTFRPVKKGEQLCLFYGPSGDRIDKQTRQTYLHRTYSFTCDCRMCKENWPADLVTPDLSKMRLMQPQIARIFGRQGMMFCQPPQFWNYDEKNLEGARKMCEFIYETFDPQNAYLLNNSLFGIYIICCFHKLYGENVDFPSLCEP